MYMTFDRETVVRTLKEKPVIPIKLDKIIIEGVVLIRHRIDFQRTVGKRASAATGVGTFQTATSLCTNICAQYG